MSEKLTETDYQNANEAIDAAEAKHRSGPPPGVPSAPAEPIMQFFAYGHLPAAMQQVSRPFGELAERIVDTLPRNAERTVALRKLLEAKDAAVRAALAK